MGLFYSRGAFGYHWASDGGAAGACRIALLARHLLGEKPRRAEFGLCGSRGTHLALVAGTLGFRPDDLRLKESFKYAEEEGLEVELGEVHPNTVRIVLEGEKEHLTVTGSSLSGGLVRVFEVDGFEVRITGQAPTLVVKNVDTPGVVARVIADDEVNIAHREPEEAGGGGHDEH